jgi:5-methylcytosine-specific restriction endonuclease McrA
MPAKLALLEDQIVSQWLNDPEATTRTLAQAYGCAYSTIACVLRKHLTSSVIDQVKRGKISRSTAARPDLKTEAHRERARYASSCVTPQGRERITLSLAQGAIVSANRRRGVPLSEVHREKMKGERPHTRGEKAPNWKGGASAYQWRKPNWRERRDEARERDKNTCQICGMTAEQAGQNMDVHHIKSYRDFDDPAEANQLSNLVCLCRTCHLRVENGVIEYPMRT